MIPSIRAVEREIFLKKGDLKDEEILEIQKKQ